MLVAVRAHEYGGPEVLRVDELTDLEPGEGEALVRVEAAGVNFIDVYHRMGTYRGSLPVRLGLEGAGVVERVGPGTLQVVPGDRVAWANVSGSYATHIVAPTETLVPVPAAIPASSAAAAMLQGMTAHYLTHDSYPIRPGDTVLVHAAAGGVGRLVCQMAKRLGARVIGTVSSDEKAQVAREAGADEIIIYTRRPFDDEVRRLTAGRGAQAVYDGVGRDTFARSLNSLANRGYMILFGQASGPVPPVDPQILNDKGGLYLQRPRLALYTATREELLRRAGEVLAWVAEGSLRLLIGGTYPLAEAARAHRDLEGRRTMGKLLLIP